MQAELVPEPAASAFEFGEPLTLKYQPQTVQGFIGMVKQKAILSALLKRPRPCALVLIGPPGVGKTTIALAFARQLRAGLIQIPSQKATVDSIDKAWETVHYYPESGGFWCVICDEADKMSYAAQIALLSKLDSVGSLKPVFGGGYTKGKPLPVIWIFTCNGRGQSGVEPPSNFEPRFLSRCLKIEFRLSDVNGELPDFLRAIWDSETDTAEDGTPDFGLMATDADNCVRDALQALELEILKAPKWAKLDCGQASEVEAEPPLVEAEPVEAVPEPDAPIDAKAMLTDALARIKRQQARKVIGYWDARDTIGILEAALKAL